MAQGWAAVTSITVHHRSLLSAILVASPMFALAHSSMSLSLPASCWSPSASLQWSLGWWSFPVCCVWWCDQNVSSSFSSFVSLAWASFLIVLKSRRWSCACRHDTRSSRRYVHISNASIFSWWLSLSMPTIHTRMWQQRRRWLWLCVV